MSDVKLGHQFWTEHKRDAIHIALLPVEAGETLKPGEHVGLIGPNKAGKSETPIGIIDPFLLGDVRKGSKCWLLLYQNTITALRHEWTHPLVDESVSTAEAQAWIAEFARELDQTYTRLMAAANLWVETQDDSGWGEHTFDNSETYKNVEGVKWPIFWKHYETLTGRRPKDSNDQFFTCSC